MAKGAYIGINNVARKIKKGYIGVDGVARKIKKAYIGIGGVARPCWSDGGQLVYYGLADDLTYRRYDAASTHVGNYAIFAGGCQTPGGVHKTVEVYNSSLSKSTASNLSSTGTDPATESNPVATHVGNYAVVITNKFIDAYSESLIKSNPTQPNTSKNNTSATHVGNYALFAGGSSYNSLLGMYEENGIVDVYNTSLTHTTTTNLGKARFGAAATHVGNYAIFAGGGTTPSTMNYVDAYDSSLTKISNISTLSVGRQCLAATCVGSYALFGGGINNSSVKYDTVESFDSSLVRSLQTTLQSSRYYLSATHVDNFAIFAGGYDTKDNPADCVDVYNMSLTRESQTALSRPVVSPAATHVGNYAIFAGGNRNSTQYSNSGSEYVYVYAVI